MKTIETTIKKLLLIEREPFVDPRGQFSRIFCSIELKEVLKSRSIVQINHSVSRRVGTVRGMHFQYPPFMETKIIRCVRGRVWDVAVDLRQNSPTFLKWHAEELSEHNRRMILVPEGFAHGFQTLEENSEVLYLHTAEYSPEAVGRVNHADPRLGIVWPRTVTDISVPDMTQPFLDDNFLGLEA